MRIKEFILNFLFPKKCVLCNKILSREEKEDACIACLHSIKYISVSDCNNDKNSYYDRVICVCKYDGLIKEGMHAFKFKGKRKLYKFYSKLLIDKLNKIKLDYDCIISVPMHKEKQKKRGYNQAELIAEEVAKNINKEIIKDNLIRIVNTESQFKLDRTQKKANMENAFAIVDKSAINGKRVLLIDDIFTTGATMNECAKTLKQNGATLVIGLTVALAKLEQL